MSMVGGAIWISTIVERGGMGAWLIQRSPSSFHASAFSRRFRLFIVGQTTSTISSKRKKPTDILPSSWRISQRLPLICRDPKSSRSSLRRTSPLRLGLRVKFQKKRGTVDVVERQGRRRFEALKDRSVLGVDGRYQLCACRRTTIVRTRHVSGLQISPLPPLIGNYISRSTPNPTPGSNEPWSVAALVTVSRQTLSCGGD